MNRAEKINILRDADAELFDSHNVGYDEINDKELDAEIALTLKMSIRNVRFLTRRVEELTGLKK